MSTAILEQPRSIEANASTKRTSQHAAPLLVATDASPSSDAAVRAALAIASLTGQQVRVLAVRPPQPVASPEAQLASPPNMEGECRRELETRVRGQLDHLVVSAPWPVHVVTGDPAIAITSVAKSRGASMIIMGLGGHGILDRVFGDEMVLKVLRLGTVPVLAVAPNFSGLPKQILAAVDFSLSGLRALTLAGRMIQPGTNLTLAHVVSSDLDSTNWTATNAGYSGTVGRSLDRMIAEAGFGEGGLVQRKVLAGDPARELLALAAAEQPDLLVTGSHGHNFVTRLLLGSVSTRLLREANCSILIAPPAEGAEFMDELPKVTTQFSSYEWAERLEEFTRRNAGRRATLEEIDPELGAQVQERGATFTGAAFDPRDGRVSIMFSSTEYVERHLTRNISGVNAVQMLRDRAGRDLLLRVAHGRGQTLLTLER